MNSQQTLIYSSDPKGAAAPRVELHEGGDEFSEASLQEPEPQRFSTVPVTAATLQTHSEGN